MKVHDLKPAAGSRHEPRRVGRGIAGAGGKTAGRGTKGQGARNTVRIGFQGGQLSLIQRTPKARGFKNPFTIEYQAINLDALDAFETGSEVTPASMRSRGLVHKGALVKVLGRGQVTKALTVKAHAFSKAAVDAIQAAGGSVEIVAKPYGDRRPPARGNALMNR